MRPAAIVFMTFAVLKVSGTIHWTWLWILSPLWIVAAILMISIIISAAKEAKEEMDENRKWTDEDMRDFGSFNRAIENKSTLDNFETYKKLKKRSESSPQKVEI